jgi:hypothetical protein
MLNMTEKKCTRCGELKSLSEFYKRKLRNGWRSECKACTNENTMKWRTGHRESVNARQRQYFAKNSKGILQVEKKRRAAQPISEKGRERLRKWRREHPERVKEIRNRSRMNHLDKNRAAALVQYYKNPERYKEYAKQWRIANRERFNATARKCNAKKMSTPKGRLNHNISSCIYHSVRDAKANRHWESLVDFTVDQLKRHLEKQFTPEMNWDNYGTVWEIDHKTPIAAFNFERPEDIDFHLCWSLKNLQPLEREKNRSKGAKIEKPFQPSLLLHRREARA